MEVIKQEARRLTEFLVQNHEYLSTLPTSHVQAVANFQSSGRHAIRCHRAAVFPQTIMTWVTEAEVVAVINDALSAISEASFNPETGWFLFLKD